MGHITTRPCHQVLEELELEPIELSLPEKSALSESLVKLSRILSRRDWYGVLVAAHANVRAAGLCARTLVLPRVSSLMSFPSCHVAVGCRLPLDLQNVPRRVLRIGCCEMEVAMLTYSPQGAV